MPGWGEQHSSGAGTTGQIEDAHRALDAVQVRPGPLAVRAIEAAGIIDRLRTEAESESVA
jgi:phosphate uptake regulator